MTKYLLIIPLLFIAAYILVPRNKPTTPSPAINNADTVKIAEFLERKGGK